MPCDNKHFVLQWQILSEVARMLNIGLYNKFIIIIVSIKPISYYSLAKHKIILIQIMCIIMHYTITKSMHAF